MINNLIVTVGGLKELIDANNALISELEKQTVLERLMTSIVNLAKSFAPIKTGALIRSIDWEKAEEGFAISAIWYAEYLEFGIRIPVGDAVDPREIISGGGKTAYLPFIRPAIYQVTQNIDKELNKLIEEIYKK
jgi:hypothetical protein